MLLSKSAAQKAEKRIREILKDSKALHRKTVNDEGVIEWVTTEPKIRLYGLPEKKITRQGVEIHYKIIDGWEENEYSKSPIVKQKMEVFK